MFRKLDDIRFMFGFCIYCWSAMGGAWVEVQPFRQITKLFNNFSEIILDQLDRETGTGPSSDRDWKDQKRRKTDRTTAALFIPGKLHKP